MCRSHIKFVVLSIAFKTAELMQKRSVDGPNSVSRHLGSLDRHHICKLQSVLGFERDGFHLPFPLRAVGVMRDFPDFGT
jgi:hypothetical protein